MAAGPDDQRRVDTADAPQRSEARLRALVEESQDMILAMDPDGTIMEINRAGVELLGYLGAGELIGRTEQELWANPADHDVFLRLLRENGRVKSFEVILVRRDGGTVFGVQSATLMRDAGGEVFEIHAVVVDITARIRDAQALWKANIELAEANKRLTESQAVMVQQEKLASIGQLAAGIAHEINNPLGFLKSNFSTLARYLHRIEEFLKAIVGRDAPGLIRAQEEYGISHILGELGMILQDSDAGLRRIAQIVLTLRNFSRMDPETARAPFDINGGIQSALTVAHNEVAFVAETVLDLAPLPPVECVGGEILQVLLNIVINAAQAIKAQQRSSPGKITIRSRHEGGIVSVEVEDDGPGIPADIKSRIFDPFFTTKPVGQGTGLGLSISYDIIVQRHGGSLTVRSEPGAGACFRIELPVSPAPSRKGT